MDSFISDISKREFPLNERIVGKFIRKPILEMIQEEHPNFGKESSCAVGEWNYFREQYISRFMDKSAANLDQLKATVIESMNKDTTLTETLGTDDAVPLSFGQKLADKVADFGGSWTFILSFMGFLFAWIILNAFWLNNKGYDPYPFILLNLILSCIAALQAPIIMMSQNRQEEKDRERAKKDYMINLKSELEIRNLHEKIDHLILHEQQELIEIQKIQIELMNELLAKIGERKE